MVFYGIHEQINEQALGVVQSNALTVVTLISRCSVYIIPAISGRNFSLNARLEK